MKKTLLVCLFIPLLITAQTQSKPKAPASKSSTAPKPKTGTAAKPAVKSTGSKTPAAAAKPGTALPKKPNPQVVKLTEQAYQYYRESKDAECEKTIKQILVLDPKNKDAFLLRANMAMFSSNYDEVWNNLNKIYKNNPKEPEIYSNFAMTHLNYMYLSDSFKRVLCRKTIKLASDRSDGYVNLGMVAMAGGYYEDAISCFDISFNKKWKDSSNRDILKVYYARCLYGINDTIAAINMLDKVIPRIGGSDKYTSLFLRAKYKLEYGRTDVTEDLDTLNAYAAGQPEMLALNARYLKLTGKPDSACLLAKQLRLTEGGEAFDLSGFCNDLTRSIDLQSSRKLTYSLNDNEFVISLSQFNYPGGISFAWQKGFSAGEKGQHSISSSALDSAFHQSYQFNADASVIMDKSLAFWISRLQYKDLKAGYNSKLSLDGKNLFAYRVFGHQQVEVFNAANKEILLDCIVISDGVNKVYYLDDAENPLILKIESDGLNLILVKFE